jgi:hypothetical protein
MVPSWNGSKLGARVCRKKACNLFFTRMIKKWLTNPKYQDWFAVAIIILLNAVPRLVFFFSPNFFIDGDEATFGMMIQRFLDTGHLAIFFGNQGYALVSFEVLVGSIVSLIFGSNIFSMKLAMLLFWLAAMVVLYYIGKKVFLSRRWSILAVLSVSFIPVWFDWATKARGGYLTALLFSNIIILLTLSRKSFARLAAIGLLLVLIYYAQPLWLIIILPFLVYYFWSKFKLSQPIILGVSFLTFWAATRLALILFKINFRVQNRLGFEQFWVNLKQIVKFIRIAYSDKFFDDAAISRMNIFSFWNSWIFVGLLASAATFFVYLAVRKKIRKIELAFLSAVVLFAFFLLFYHEAKFAYLGMGFSYRYLLPIFIPAIFLIALAAQRLPTALLKNCLYIFLAAYSVFSLVCVFLYPNYIYPKINDGLTEVDRIDSLGQYFKANNITCVYANDWIISQHVKYFLPGIIARHPDIDLVDAAAVDAAFKKKNDCALVGLWYTLPSLGSLYNLNDIMVVGGRYLVYLRPQRDDLIRLQFKFTN